MHMCFQSFKRRSAFAVIEFLFGHLAKIHDRKIYIPCLKGREGAAAKTAAAVERRAKSTPRAQRVRMKDSGAGKRTKSGNRRPKKAADEIARARRIAISMKRLPPTMQSGLIRIR
jgi:hypothetical protein